LLVKCQKAHESITVQGVWFQDEFFRNKEKNTRFSKNMSFWSGRLLGNKDYQLSRLVDNRIISTVPFENDGIHIICDIDKTYLETNFESLTKLARIAFEDAKDKVTVHGANEVLNAARWGAETPLDEFIKPRGLHFVSSSPPQLRAVLEEKLMLDDVEWTSDTFKNQAYNLRKGRMGLLRHHVGYKSLAILNLVLNAKPNSSFYMIGDNAESDAFIYFGVKCLLEKKFTAEEYISYLQFSGVDESSLQAIRLRIKSVPQSKVAGIFIRKVKGYQLPEAPSVTKVFYQFEDFFEVAMILVLHGVIPPNALWQLVRSFHNKFRFKLNRMAFIMQNFLQGETVDEDLITQIETIIAKLISIDTKKYKAEYSYPKSQECEAEAKEILSDSKAWIQQILGNDR